MQLPPFKEEPSKTEFLTKLCGIAAYSPFVANNSPARQQMFTNSHLAQKLVVSGMSENFVSTFLDADLGESTFCIRAPKKIRISKIIMRYPASNFEGAVVTKNSDNPEILVLYEEVETKRAGVLVIPKYLSYHPYFGFELVPTKDAARLVPGEVIEEGTILYDTSGKSNTGRYVSSVQLNTVFISHRATAEDGIAICRDVLPAFRYKRYEVRTVEFGRDFIPINVYGKDGEYKFMPDIGDYVRDDGLLVALRKYDEKLAAVDMSVNGCKRVDMYDKSIYAKGKGGRVVDIRVTTNYNYEQKGLSSVCQQLEKYIKATHRTNQDLLAWYKSKKWEGLVVTNELHVMLTRAMVEVLNGKDRYNKQYKKINVDDFRIEFVVEYELEPTIGSKLSDRNGSKGVICAILEPEEMPVDCYGRRADIIAAPESRTNRMNPGGGHEMSATDAGWHLRRLVLATFGIPFFESPSLSLRSMRYKDKERMIDGKVKLRKEWLDTEYRSDPDKFWKAWDLVINYYRIVAPLQAYIYDREDIFNYEAVALNLANIIEDMTYIVIPPDYAPNYLEAHMQMSEHIGHKRDKVTYRGLDGRTIISKGPCRISPLSWFFLEKTADSWSAVSFGKYQLHGFLAPLSKSDKYAGPGREQAVNGIGETEGRAIGSCCGPEGVAEMVDRNSNPVTRKALHLAIISAEQPGNIENAVDRNVHPFGGHRAVQIFHHATKNGAGIELRYSPET